MHVESRHNEGARDFWQYAFVIFNEATLYRGSFSFHIFCYYWSEGYRSFYRGLRLVKSRYRCLSVKKNKTKQKKNKKKKHDGSVIILYQSFSIQHLHHFTVMPLSCQSGAGARKFRVRNDMLKITESLEKNRACSDL